MAHVPADLKYTQEHEWAKVEGDRARVGITAFAQEQLGDVVFVELPKVGRHGDGQCRPSAWSSRSRRSPISSRRSRGEVVEVERRARKKPEARQQDPYGQGWMIVVKLANAERGRTRS